MRIDMRNKIDFLQLTKEQNSTGEIMNNWVVVRGGVWCSKEPLLGKEFWAANQTQVKVEVKFRCYYFDGITNDMRIKHGNDMYEIITANNVDGLNRELLCYCRLVKK